MSHRVGVRPAAIGLCWLANFGLYLVFADSTGVRELVAGAITATFATAAVVRAAVCGELYFRLRWRDLVQVWRLPYYLVSGTGEVLVALARQLFTHKGAASELAATSFEIGEHEDPAEAGRRALAVFYTTATPNFVVLGLIEEQGLMLYHQVLPGEVLTMTRKLGARP